MFFLFSFFAERFRGGSEKESEKPKVITENEPSMDEPTTTTVDNLGENMEKEMIKKSCFVASAR